MGAAPSRETLLRGVVRELHRVDDDGAVTTTTTSAKTTATVGRRAALSWHQHQQPSQQQPQPEVVLVPLTSDYFTSSRCALFRQLLAVRREPSVRYYYRDARHTSLDVATLPAAASDEELYSYYMALGEQRLVETDSELVALHRARRVFAPVPCAVAFVYTPPAQSATAASPLATTTMHGTNSNNGNNNGSRGHCAVPRARVAAQVGKGSMTLDNTVLLPHHTLRVRICGFVGDTRVCPPALPASAASRSALSLGLFVSKSMGGNYRLQIAALAAYTYTTQLEHMGIVLRPPQGPTTLAALAPTHNKAVPTLSTTTTTMATTGLRRRDDAQVAYVDDDNKHKHNNGNNDSSYSSYSNATAAWLSSSASSPSSSSSTTTTAAARHDDEYAAYYDDVYSSLYAAHDETADASGAATRPLQDNSNNNNKVTMTPSYDDAAAADVTALSPSPLPPPPLLLLLRPLTYRVHCADVPGLCFVRELRARLSRQRQPPCGTACATLTCSDDDNNNNNDSSSSSSSDVLQTVIDDTELLCSVALADADALLWWCAALYRWRFDELTSSGSSPLRHELAQRNAAENVVDGTLYVTASAPQRHAYNNNNNNNNNHNNGYERHTPASASSSPRVGDVWVTTQDVCAHAIGLACRSSNDDKGNGNKKTPSVVRAGSVLRYDGAQWRLRTSEHAEDMLLSLCRNVCDAARQAGPDDARWLRDATTTLPVGLEHGFLLWRACHAGRSFVYGTTPAFVKTWLQRCKASNNSNSSNNETTNGDGVASACGGDGERDGGGLVACYVAHMQSMTRAGSSSNVIAAASSSTAAAATTLPRVPTTTTAASAGNGGVVAVASSLPTWRRNATTTTTTTRTAHDDGHLVATSLRSRDIAIRNVNGSSSSSDHRHSKMAAAAAAAAGDGDAWDELQLSAQPRSLSCSLASVGLNTTALTPHALLWRTPRTLAGNNNNDDVATANATAAVASAATAVASSLPLRVTARTRQRGRTLTSFTLLSTSAPRHRGNGDDDHHISGSNGRHGASNGNVVASLPTTHGRNATTAMSATRRPFVAECYAAAREAATSDAECRRRTCAVAADATMTCDVARRDESSSRRHCHDDGAVRSSVIPVRPRRRAAMYGAAGSDSDSDDDDVRATLRGYGATMPIASCTRTHTPVGHMATSNASSSSTAAAEAAALAAIAESARRGHDVVYYTACDALPAATMHTAPSRGASTHDKDSNESTTARARMTLGDWSFLPHPQYAQQSLVNKPFYAHRLHMQLVMADDRGDVVAVTVCDKATQTQRVFYCRAAELCAHMRLLAPALQRSQPQSSSSHTRSLTVNCDVDLFACLLHYIRRARRHDDDDNKHNNASNDNDDDDNDNEELAWQTPTRVVHVLLAACHLGMDALVAEALAYLCDGGNLTPLLLHSGVDLRCVPRDVLDRLRVAMPLARLAQTTRELVDGGHGAHPNRALVTALLYGKAADRVTPRRRDDDDNNNDDSDSDGDGDNGLRWCDACGALYDYALQQRLRRSNGNGDGNGDAGGVRAAQRHAATCHTLCDHTAAAPRTRSVSDCGSSSDGDACGSSRRHTRVVATACARPRRPPASTLWAPACDVRAECWAWCVLGSVTYVRCTTCARRVALTDAVRHRHRHGCRQPVDDNDNNGDATTTTTTTRAAAAADECAFASLDEHGDDNDSDNDATTTLLRWFTYVHEHDVFAEVGGVHTLTRDGDGEDEDNDDDSRRMAASTPSPTTTSQTTTVVTTTMGGAHAQCGWAAHAALVDVVFATRDNGGGGGGARHTRTRNNTIAAAAALPPNADVIVFHERALMRELCDTRASSSPPQPLPLRVYAAGVRDVTHATATLRARPCGSVNRRGDDDDVSGNAAKRAGATTRMPTTARTHHAASATAALTAYASPYLTAMRPSHRPRH